MTPRCQIRHREATRNVDSEHWRCKEQGEFSSLLNNYKCFHFVEHKDILAGAKVLDARFVCRRALCLPGQEDVASVAKFTLIRVLVALAARNRMLIHQADVDKAYLHSALEEDLYMRIPKGIDSLELAGKVLKLNRVLYGLRQPGCVWIHRIMPP
ncbi:hypothetical protein JCM8547_000683, partial [Rhodosporidiobolus lusitaniae]